MQKDQPRMQWL
uniref:Uncharacterized protein n=1 Tax=Arundo donax TaxID=35708 RepID=A0A0A9H554_ARUDO